MDWIQSIVTGVAHLCTCTSLVTIAVARLSLVIRRTTVASVKRVDDLFEICSVIKKFLHLLNDIRKKYLPSKIFITLGWGQLYLKKIPIFSHGKIHIWTLSNSVEAFIKYSYWFFHPTELWIARHKGVATITLL